MTRVDADKEGVPKFVRPDDRAECFGVPVVAVKYGYYEGDKFWAAYYEVAPENAKDLLLGVKRAYGDPDWTDDDGFPHWIYPKGTKGPKDRKDDVVRMTYAIEQTGEATLIVMSSPVTRMVIASEEAKERAKAEKAEADRVKASSGHVYTAVFSCSAMGQEFPIGGCFTKDTGIKVTAGSVTKLYTLFDMRNIKGAFITDLPESFVVQAQNSGQNPLVLTLRIARADTGKVVYEDSAQTWGWLKVKN